MDGAASASSTLVADQWARRRAGDDRACVSRDRTDQRVSSRARPSMFDDRRQWDGCSMADRAPLIDPKVNVL